MFRQQVLLNRARMRMVTLLSVLMTLMAMVVMSRMVVMLKMLVASSSS